MGRTRAARHGRASIDVLSSPLGPIPEGVGTLECCEHPDARKFEVADALEIQGRERKQGKSDQIVKVLVQDGRIRL